MAVARPWFDAPGRLTDFGEPARSVPVSVMGAHGGAGTTTVARLLGACDAGRAWPHPGDSHPPRVLLVARTHAAGLMAASRELAGYCADRCPDGPYLAGLVLVADAPGRLPKPLKRRVTILLSATMVHMLPWVPAWRLSDTTADQNLAEGLRRFAEHASLATTPAMDQ